MITCWRGLSRHRFRVFAPLLAVVVLDGCATTVAVQPDFPTPLVEPLPLHVGVHYSDAFRDYMHKEEKTRNDNFVVELGEANVGLFDKLFAAVFTRTREVKAHELPFADLDGIIEPRVEKYEFMLPQAPDGEFYQVWIDYRMDLYSTAGELLAEWPIQAYGKSRDRGLRRSKRLREATRLALRDAAARFVTHFREEPGVEQWLIHRHAIEGEADEPSPRTTLTGPSS